ncbi:hypothetical protein CP532_3638 [Ophiocordyceps camponoti-leonardi (nom. inval.)]|nr:hypothetical protein CP532_3638 [Ophiocordyceps camponoti-leonardi (nom. inval.)]
MVSTATRYNPLIMNGKKRTRRLTARGPCKSLGCCAEEKGLLLYAIPRIDRARAPEMLYRLRRVGHTRVALFHAGSRKKGWSSTTTPKLSRRSRRIIHFFFPLSLFSTSNALLSAGALVVVQRSWPSCVSSVVVIARAVHTGKSGRRLNLQAGGSPHAGSDFMERKTASGNFWVVRSTSNISAGAAGAGRPHQFSSCSDAPPLLQGGGGGLSIEHSPASTLWTRHRTACTNTLWAQGETGRPIQCVST